MIAGREGGEEGGEEVEEVDETSGWGFYIQRQAITPHRLHGS